MSVVVRGDARGRGLGGRVVALVEAEAAERGFGYCYLWTRVPGFYERLGYRVARKVALHRASLAALPEGAVDALEAALAARRPPEPPEANARADDEVWMRKRVLDRCPAAHRAPVSRECLVAAVGGEPATCGPGPFFWERQVGPSCGCAALTLAAAALLGAPAAAAAAKGSAPLPGGCRVDFDPGPPPSPATSEGALRAALRLDASTDGEIFDARDLARVAAAIGLGALVVEAPRHEDAARAVEAHLGRGGLVALAYDRGDACDDYAPALRRGHRAHYALIVAARRADGNALRVAALHGLTKWPLVADLAALLASNAQIDEIDPDEAAWIRPQTTLRLKDRLVLLAAPQPR